MYLLLYYLISILAAVTHGKGLRGIPMQGMPPGMHGGPSSGPHPSGIMVRPMNQPGKVQSTIKTNIKAGAQVHPYQRN